MLHHGDNLEVMGTLLSAGTRVHLAYLDPPFCTGRDFAYEPPGGGLEEHAYSDKWPSLEAFIRALRERVALVRALLAPDGCMVLHADPATSHYVKVMLDSVFGRACFANEIIWRYRRWPTKAPHFQWMHDVLFRYVRDAREKPRWTQLHEPLAPSTVATWGKQKQRAQVQDGRRVRSTTTAELTPGAPMSDVWTDIGILAPVSSERTGYPTQKPEALLERIVTACSYELDTVLDPFAGSCTSGVVAERLRRSWIGIDYSPVAVRVGTTRLCAARFGVKPHKGAQASLGEATARR